MKHEKKKITMNKALSTLAVATLLTILFSQCKHNDIPKDIPACVKNVIEKIKSQNVRNPPASVWQYDYDGKTVFYIPPYCCDELSRLIDTDCNPICSPDGGIGGAGDGKCPDFFSKRTNEKQIWQDSRK